MRCGWWRPGDALLAPSITRRLIEDYARRGRRPLPIPTDLGRLTPREQRGARAHRPGREQRRDRDDARRFRSDGQDARRPCVDEARAARSGARGHLRVRGRHRGSDHGWTRLIAPGADDIRRPVAHARCMLRLLGSCRPPPAPHRHGCLGARRSARIRRRGVLFSSLDADLDDPASFESEQVSRRLDALAPSGESIVAIVEGAPVPDETIAALEATPGVATVVSRSERRRRRNRNRSRVGTRARRRHRRGCGGSGRIDRAQHRRTRGARGRRIAGRRRVRRARRAGREAGRAVFAPDRDRRHGRRARRLARSRTAARARRSAASSRRCSRSVSSRPSWMCPCTPSTS